MADTSPSSEDRFTIVIVGGGAAGISIAAQLKKHRSNLSIAIIEPSTDRKSVV